MLERSDRLYPRLGLGQQRQPAEETEEESATVSPQAQPEETLPGTTLGGGIVTHRAGDQGRGLKRLQQGAIHGNTNLRTHRAGESSRGKIPVHRMGRSDQSNIRTHRMGRSDQSNIRTHRMGG